MATSAGSVECERDGRTAWITLAHEQRRNALDIGMYDMLEGILDDLRGQRGEVRALILRGAGTRAFCAGTDISHFQTFQGADDVLAYEARIDRVVGKLERLPMPAVAAISGACTGAGAALASACDLRVAADNLKVGFPVARTIGNCLSMGNYRRLRDLIGTARVKEMVLTARLYTAGEAKDIGWLSEVVPAGTSVFDRAAELAELLGRHAPLTMWATKEALRRLRDDPGAADGDDLMVTCYLSGDSRRAVNAFLAGERATEWEGR